MKKIISIVLLSLFPLGVQAKVNIVTTTTDMAAIAREVGGDLVTVESLARGDQDPHYLEPKPSYAVKLNGADLLIEVGLELEIGWLPVLLTQARNPKIQRGQLGHLDASKNIPIIEIPTGKIDRAHGDIHPLGNPHYWIDPRNGLIIARAIADRLAQLDAQHADTYRQNLDAFSTRLQQHITEWTAQAAVFHGREVVTYHKSFSYLVNWLGLKVADVIEPKPGIPPSPSHLAQLVDKIRSQKIPLIILENYNDPKPAQELGKKTQTKVLAVATSVGGDPAVKTYEDIFIRLLTQLKEVL